MSLSKIYENGSSFEPAELITRRVSNTLEFDSIITEHLPVKEKEQTCNAREQQGCEEHVPTPPPQEPPPASVVHGVPRADVDRMLAEAYERGKLDGSALAEEDFGSATRALLQSCNQLDSIKETIFANSRDYITELVMAISEKVIRSSVVERTETIFNTVEEAIQQAIMSEEFCIYVHPADYDTVTGRSDDLIGSVTGLKSISVKKDSTISQGGCRIESDRCSVDATIESQLVKIRAALSESA